MRRLAQAVTAASARARHDSRRLGRQGRTWVDASQTRGGIRARRKRRAPASALQRCFRELLDRCVHLRVRAHRGRAAARACALARSQPNRAGGPRPRVRRVGAPARGSMDFTTASFVDSHLGSRRPGASDEVDDFLELREAAMRDMHRPGARLRNRTARALRARSSFLEWLVHRIARCALAAPQGGTHRRRQPTASYPPPPRSALLTFSRACRVSRPDNECLSFRCASFWQHLQVVGDHLCSHVLRLQGASAPQARLAAGRARGGQGAGRGGEGQGRGRRGTCAGRRPRQEQRRVERRGRPGGRQARRTQHAAGSREGALARSPCAPWNASRAGPLPTCREPGTCTAAITGHTHIGARGGGFC